MKPVHNYKLLPGNRLNGEPPGFLSSHYDCLPFLIHDAKEVIATHKLAHIVLRRPFEITVCDMYADGTIEWVNDEEYSRIVSAVSFHLLLAGKTKAEQEYLSKVYPGILWQELRTLQAELPRSKSFIERLSEANARENKGNGIRCVHNIISALFRNNFEDAINIRRNEGDKICNYPKIEKLLLEHFGCRLHAIRECEKWTCGKSMAPTIR